MSCAVPITNESKETCIRYVHGRELGIGKGGAAGDVKKESVPAETDISADVASPIRINRSEVLEFGFGRDELLAGRQEKFVFLKLLVLAVGAALVSLESAFQTENEAPELHFDS